MPKVAWQRISGRVNITLCPLFFDWNGVAPKFFAMIHNVLSDDIAINPGDFSAVASNNLAEVVAQYDIFGGNSNISLRSDRLSMEFPTLVPGDEKLVLPILEKVATAFRQTFPGHRFMTVQVGLFQHGAIPEDVSVTEYLARHGTVVADSAFGDLETVHQAAVRFGTRAADGTWRANCTLEQSGILPNGLFMDLDVVFPNMDEDSGFQDWVENFLVVAGGYMSALELEWNVGT